MARQVRTATQRIERTPTFWHRVRYLPVLSSRNNFEDDGYRKVGWEERHMSLIIIIRGEAQIQWFFLPRFDALPDHTGARRRGRKCWNKSFNIYVVSKSDIDFRNELKLYQSFNYFLSPSVYFVTNFLPKQSTLTAYNYIQTQRLIPNPNFWHFEGILVMLVVVRNTCRAVRRVQRPRLLPPCGLDGRQTWAFWGFCQSPTYLSPALAFLFQISQISG